MTTRPSPRLCRGEGTTTTATSSAASPEAAIEALARQDSVAPWFHLDAPLPTEGWFRRDTSLYEHGAANGAVLQADVVEQTGSWTVTGVWLCTPVPA